MYDWLIFLHVLSAFGFLFAHGASAIVMFRVRAEHDPARIGALLDLSNSVGGAVATSALLLFLSGIGLGFLGGWWGRGWIWASLTLFVVIGVLMSWLGRMYFERVRRALGIPTDADRNKKIAPPPALPQDEVAAVLASGRPVVLAIVGLGGLAVITWLMMFKPF